MIFTLLVQIFMFSKNMAALHIQNYNIILFHYPVTSEGFIEFSEVTAVLRNRSTVTVLYKSITTAAIKTISLTENHLIYAKKHSAGIFHAM